MITLMPNIGFFKSLRQLDDDRLSKQRQDAFGALELLLGPKPKTRHIMMDMWDGYEYVLGVYGMSACSEWQNKRGNRDKIAFEIHARLEGLPKEFDMPPWMEDLDFHRSHRSYLIRKMPEFYEELWPNTPLNMPLLWPKLTDADPRGYLLRLSTPGERQLLSGERELPDWLHYDKMKHEIINLEEEK